ERPRCRRGRRCPSLDSRCARPARRHDARRLRSVKTERGGCASGECATNPIGVIFDPEVSSPATRPARREGTPAMAHTNVKIWYDAEGDYHRSKGAVRFMYVLLIQGPLLARPSRSRGEGAPPPRAFDLACGGHGCMVGHRVETCPTELSGREEDSPRCA